MHFNKGNKMKKAIIFDMDGVIFDTEPHYFQGYLTAYKNAKIEFSKEDYLEYIGRASKEDFKDILLRTKNDEKLANEIFREAMNIQKELSKENLSLMEGLEELLNFLKDNNLKAHIASSSKKETILTNLKTSNLTNYFDIIVGGDEITHSKPHPEIYLKVLELAQIKENEAIVVEDSIAGITSAYNANIDVIMIPNMIKPNYEIKQRVSLVLNNLNEVKDYLAKLI